MVNQSVKNCDLTYWTMEKCTKCGLDRQSEAVACSCSCNNCSNIVFDHVLAYCQSFLNNYSVQEVARAMEYQFPANDVIQARDLLRTQFMDKLKDLNITKVASRRSSNNRSHLEANAYDVAEAMYLLTNEQNRPRFVTEHINKLPVISPSLACPKDQAAAILMLEKKMLRMEGRQDATDDVLKQHERQITDFEKSGHKDQPASSQCALSLPPPGPGFGKRDIERQKKTADQAIQQVLHSGEASQALSSRPSWSGMAAELNNADGDWQNVNRTKRNALPKRRPAPMQGTAKDTKFKAGRGPSRDIWIYNVHKDMSDDELHDYIANGGSTAIKKVEIRHWEKRYKDTYEHKCFRLTIAKSDYEYVFKPEFWPLDVHFRKYWLSKDEIAALKGPDNPVST